MQDNPDVALNHLCQFFDASYKGLISSKHPHLVGTWPLLGGYNVVAGHLGDGWLAIHLQNTGVSAMRSYKRIGRLPPVAFGGLSLTQDNREALLAALHHHFRPKPEDAILLVEPAGLHSSQLETILRSHEQIMGLIKQRIFLSHKNPDKGWVREFKSTLELLGFDPWLDEDAMPAGTSLERGILRGMQESCAAIFFLTPRFSDENFLASEIEYARAEQRARPRDFVIISLVFGESGRQPAVPGLLRPFVWKEPKSELEALREIVRALPLRVGGVRVR
ncbi:MAG: toll/interleukin-1 receptor domain-containing protein [Phreatobacter sp.]|nr:toll/interleukin-1 receptor domain-containing protein [Phreatobacter sp.]